MANMQMNKTPMPEQDPNVRNANFKEVALGYTMEQAMNEAQRCLQCKNPACVSGCPVGIPIPQFLGKVAEGDIAAAYEILSNANALPAISGRVCPQENQCEGKSPSAAWSALSLTGPPRTASPTSPPPPRTATRSPSSVPAPPA